jgi:hypothetical protein
VVVFTATAALPQRALAQNDAPSPPPPASSAPAASAPPPPASSAPAASAPPPPASSAPAASAPAAPAFIQPTGTPVEIEATRPLISVFIAPGSFEDTTPHYPDPFVKIGRTPIKTKLVPGVYTLSAESPEIPVGSTIVHVGSEPVHVRVKAGSDGMRGLGTLLLAAGATAVLAGVVVELSYTKAPNGISKSKIAVPLFAVGGAGVASGLTLYLLSSTTFEQNGPTLDRRSAGLGLASVW